MGYIRGFVHGTIAGTVVGLCVAPQTGERTRAQLQEGVNAVREGVQVTARALQRVAPVATTAVQTLERVRHRNDGELALRGDGTIGTPAG